MNILILDGSYLLHRALHIKELADMQSPTGRPTGGLFSLLKTVLYQLNTPWFDRVYCVLDGSRSARRLEIYPEYKANRKAAPGKEEEKERHDFLYKTNEALVQQILPLVGVRVMKLPDAEGDDVIYRITRYYLDRGDRVRIVTEDGDMTCFFGFEGASSGKLSIYKPRSQETVTEKTIKDGDTPVGWLLERKVLLGDSSDNITPAVAGFGEKSVDSMIEWSMRNGYPEGPVDATQLVNLAQEMQVDPSTTPRLRTALAKVVESRGGEYNRNMDLIDVRAQPLDITDRLDNDSVQKDIPKAIQALGRLGIKSLSAGLVGAGVAQLR